nr:hypothetical protein [Tanacetum cinerariifolium]
MLQSYRNQSVGRQPITLKSKRPGISKPCFASQVDVYNDLSKPVTTHYLHKEREAAFAKPHHIIASSNSRISSKNMPRFSSNDMVYNHYLEEAKQKTQERKVNSCAKVPSNKITNRNKPVEQISVPNKQERQIPTGHRFLIKKTSVVQKKTITPRSCLRWKPTGRIFKTIGLRWVPTGKIFASSTTKVDSEPINGSNADITNQYECEQTLDVSVGGDDDDGASDDVVVVSVPWWSRDGDVVGGSVEMKVMWGWVWCLSESEGRLVAKSLARSVDGARKDERRG